MRKILKICVQLKRKSLKSVIVVRKTQICNKCFAYINCLITTSHEIVKGDRLKSHTQKNNESFHSFNGVDDTGFILSNNFSASINPPSGPNDKYFTHLHLFKLLSIKDFCGISTHVEHMIQTRKFRHMTTITKLIADLGSNGSARQWRWRWSTLFTGG